MKKIQNLLITSIILLCHTSCQKYSYIENELHGLWQVTSVEDKTTGETTKTQGELYYSFQRNMVIVGYNSPNKPTGLMMTQYISDYLLEGDSIQMNNFRIYQEYETKPPLQSLKKFGIYDECTTFHIKKSKKGVITFESNKALIGLRRY